MKDLLNAPSEPAVPLGAPPSARATVGFRVNVPLNLQQLAHLKPAHRDTVIWFHQHVLDHSMSWPGAVEALGFASDHPGAAESLMHLLRGTATADPSDLVARMEDYRKIIAERVSLQLAEFCENPVTQMIYSGLDYALAGQHIAIIEGDSGHGKTEATEAWAATRAKGRAVKFEVPALGGVSMFVATIAKSIGYTRVNFSMAPMCDAIFRAFNPERMLIADEGTRLLPKNRSLSPDKLEFMREIHDRTGAPLGIVATRRLSQEMEHNSNYLFEQVLGRCMPIRLPLILEESVYRPIVVQYYPRPTKALLTACGQLANNEVPLLKGRLRLLTEVLKLASRIASKKKSALAEAHFFTALALRKQMMGDPAQQSAGVTA